jgi:hypothetical protein
MEVLGKVVIMLHKCWTRDVYQEETANANVMDELPRFECVVIDIAYLRREDGKVNTYCMLSIKPLFSFSNSHATMQFFALACKQDVARGCVNLGVMKYEGTQISKDPKGRTHSSTECLKDMFISVGMDVHVTYPVHLEIHVRRTGPQMPYLR